MSFHPTLVPLPGTSPAYGWNTLHELGSGGFATVRALGPAEVLKLSCCEASNEWMSTARRQPARWPAAFPAIYENLGIQATDADGMRFHGWRIERLFDFEDVEAAIRARAACIGQRMRQQPRLACEPVFPRRDEHAALVTACAACQLEPEAHWTKDACAALVLAATCEAELRTGFLGLFRFIERSQVRLDVAHPGNLMMDCFGRVRLADPLSMRLDVDANAPVFTRHWALARLPTAQSGLSVQTLWRAVPTATADAAQALVQELSERFGTALEARVERERQSVAALLGMPARSEPVFHYGKQLGALLDGTASDTFFAGLDMAG